MKTLVCVAVLLAAAPAVAKPWQGIEPGQSKRDSVIQKFGEPSRVVTTEGKEVVAYFDERAIKGTRRCSSPWTWARSTSSASRSSRAR
ncbi:hypothetical protein ACN28S_34020 [Cystobacter fuscus]